jgi:hypothetical protein
MYNLKNKKLYAGWPFLENGGHFFSRDEFAMALELKITLKASPNCVQNFMLVSQSA